MSDPESPNQLIDLGPPRGPRLSSLDWCLRACVLAIFLIQIVLVYDSSFYGLSHPTAIGTDPWNYLAAGERLNAGHPLYGPLLPDDRIVPLKPPFFSVPLLSPPLIAVIWRPLALLPATAAMTGWWLAGLILMVGLVIWLVATGRSKRLILLILLLTVGPVYVTFVGDVENNLGPGPGAAIAAWSGNINTALAVLLAAVWWAESRGRSKVAGALAALAAVLKVTPALLLIWFFVRRDWRAVRAFLFAAAGLAIVSLVGGGLDNNLAYLRVVGDTAASGPTPLSIPGLLGAVSAPTILVRTATLIVTVSAVCLIWLTRGRPNASFAITVGAIVFSSPVVLSGNYALLLAAIVPFGVAPLVEASNRAELGESRPSMMSRLGSRRRHVRILLATGLSAGAIAVAFIAVQGGKSEAQLATDALNAGIAAHAAGNLTEAQKQYQECLKYDATDKFCHYNLGLIAQTQSDLVTAENEYRLSLSNDPNYTPAIFNLAIARTADSDTTEALSLYRKYVQLLPNDAGGHLSLGLLLVATGDTENGQKEIATAVQLDPTIKVPLQSQAPSAAPGTAPSHAPSASPKAS